MDFYIFESIFFLDSIINSCNITESKDLISIDWQKALEKLDNGNYYKNRDKWIKWCNKKFIENHLYELCCDKNRNNVYQKLLRVFPKERNHFLCDELMKISFSVSIIHKEQHFCKLLLIIVIKNNKKNYVLS